MKQIIAGLLILIATLLTPTVCMAEETLEVVVKDVLKESQTQTAGESEIEFYQKLKVLVTSGSLKDREIEIENGNYSLVNTVKYKEGDELVVSYDLDSDGNEFYFITDYVRRKPMIWLFLIFVVLTITIARLRGLMSLLGMGLSFGVIFKFILPEISAGKDPVVVAILGSLLIIPITFLLSHGFNKKTWIGMLGTLIALIFTAILAALFVELTKLTGFASEEAAFLQVDRQGAISIKGLLLAGIIIGVLGILDDITISQSAIVFQLKKADLNLKFDELYKKAMDVGQDHIASMVNTLVLVYAGAALPLLLLFVNSSHPFSEIVNYEIIADEVVRTLVGSIGLVLAVPITTLVAALVASKKGKIK